MAARFGNCTSWRRVGVVDCGRLQVRVHEFALNCTRVSSEDQNTPENRYPKATGRCKRGGMLRDFHIPLAFDDDRPRDLPYNVGGVVMACREIFGLRTEMGRGNDQGDLNRAVGGKEQRK